ncbi:hypothetical protein CYY_007222 [Polysphondylium violaceum]|uniref:Cell surface glycoprotein n=1 Tax=Polysphondylium violaceum TaxID=133409 RepID=A0A8J4PPX3_9MYCE|nr:hypothetical protein CYY_007222 [Polysphondylium violaceum]
MIFKYLSLLLIVTIFAHSCSGALNQQEYTAFMTIANKIGYDVSVETVDTLCVSTPGRKFVLLCSNFGNEQRITTLLLQPGATLQTFQASEFPFPKLNTIRANSMNFGNNFIVEIYTYAPLLKTFECSYCFIDQILSNSYSSDPNIYFYYYPLYSNMSGTHSMTNILGFNGFSNENSKDDCNFVTEKTQKRTISNSDLTLYTASFPDLQYYTSIETIKIIPNKNFPSGPIENIQNLTQTAQIHFLNNLLPTTLSLVFPETFETFEQNIYSPNSMRPKEKIWKLFSDKIDWSFERKMDMSKTRLEILEIKNGNFSLADGSGEFPISVFNTTALTNLVITNSNLKQVNFDNLTKIYSVDLTSNQITMEVPEVTLYSDDASAWTTFYPYYNVTRNGIGQVAMVLDKNQFYGSIPSWFCNVMISFKSNNFSGELPPCFACYLKDPVVRTRISKNKFSNFNDSMTAADYPPCTTIAINNFYISDGFSSFGFKGKYFVHIIGQDFGVSSTIKGTFSSLPTKEYVLTALKHNEWYMIQIPDDAALESIKTSESLNITFVTPGISIILNTTKMFDNIYPFNSTYVQAPFPRNPALPIPTEAPTNPPTTSTTTSSTSSNPTTSSTSNPTSSTSNPTTSSTSSPTTSSTSNPTTSSTSNPTTSGSGTSTGSGSSSGTQPHIPTTGDIPSSASTISPILFIFSVFFVFLF